MSRKHKKYDLLFAGLSDRPIWQQWVIVIFAGFAMLLCGLLFWWVPILKGSDRRSER